MLDYFKIQTAIELASDAFKGVESSKPTLLHSMRCGIKLMNDGFDTEVVIAGVLHDVVEDTSVTVEDIDEQYGGRVAKIVAANTKDPTIVDSNERREELIKRCCLAGMDAVLVKLSDIYDNYLYYKAIDDQKLVNYCLELKSYILQYISIADKGNSYIKDLLNKIV